MKNIIALTLLILLSLTFYSCEKEIIFKGETVEPEIVLNSYLTTDSVVSCLLTKSRFFLSNQSGFDSISNADVSVYVNDAFKEKLNYVISGYYRGTYIPKAGDKIKLLVVVPESEKQVEGTAFIPQPSNILSVDTTLFINFIDTIYQDKGVIAGFHFSKNCDIKLKINDQGDVDNYYRLVAKRRAKNYWDESQEYYDYFVSFKLEGMDTQSGNLFDLFEGGENYSDEHLLTDELFNGKEFVFRFLIDYSYDYVKPEYEELFNLQNNEEIVLNLQTITKDMYLYLKSKQAADNIADGLFAEPVQIYNNITNGIGILGSQTNNEYKLILK